MSVVVGLVKDGKVYMAADTRCLEGYAKTYTKKLFVNKHPQWGMWAIGAAGYMRNVEIATELDLPTLKGRDKRNTTLPVLCRGYFDCLREEVSNRGMLKDGEAESAFMLAIKGRLFVIESSFCMTEITTLKAVGTGGDYAEGTLWALQKFCPDMDPAEMVRAAVESAIYYNVSVGGDIDVAVIG